MTQKLLTEALELVADIGFAETTIAGLAAAAGTSKQAIYRRWPNKAELVAEAVRQAILTAPLPSAQRGNAASDLLQILAALMSALYCQPLGKALCALLPFRTMPPIGAVFDDFSDRNRLALRQTLIATPFEEDMETRIDLILGWLTIKQITAQQPVTERELEAMVSLVLGLRAPRDPDRAPVPFP